jgi:hypothetical protein
LSSEAIAIDVSETAIHGQRCGDELPEAIATAAGRKGWLRAARQQLDHERALRAEPIPRSRPARLTEAKRRLEEDLAAEREINANYEAYRARGVDKTGRGIGAPPKPYTPPDTPDGKINTTDVDSKLVHGMRGWIQGYNAQAICNEQHLTLAADVMTASPDFGHLGPMLSAAQSELAGAGVTDTPRRGCRRRRLASGTDERDHRPRHPGAHPARLQPPQEHQARLERRCL